MTSLRVDQHGIHGVGVDLPFPPDADIFRTAHAVLRREIFQHQAFHAQAAGLSPLACEVGPTIALQHCRNYQLRLGDVRHQFVKLLAPG